MNKKQTEVAWQAVANELGGEVDIESLTLDFRMNQNGIAAVLFKSNLIEIGRFKFENGEMDISYRLFCEMVINRDGSFNQEAFGGLGGNPESWEALDETEEFESHLSSKTITCPDGFKFHGENFNGVCFESWTDYVGDLGFESFREVIEAYK
tara:strand:+ start:108 stop:563 length:456 start_codon:yes stop_codon:yes gene_type:complete